MTGQNHKPLNIYDDLPLFLANDIEKQICIISIETVDGISINMICFPNLTNKVINLENLSSFSK